MTKLFSRLLLIAVALCYADAARASYALPKQVFRPLSNQIGNQAYYYWDMVKGPDGYLWIATSNGLLKYDGYEFKRVVEVEKLVHAIELDDKNNVWIAASSGVYRYDYASGKFSHFAHDKNDPNSLPYGPVNRLFRDSQGKLWLGMLEHFVEYDEVNNIFTAHSPWDKSGNIDTSEMSARYVGITSANESVDGSFWLGTYNNGLIRLNQAKDKAEILRSFSFDEIFVKRVKSIVKLDKQNLLLATNDGLLRFDTQEQRFHRYPEQNPINQSLTTLIKADNGGFWAGGDNVFYIDPNQNVVVYHQDKDFGISEKGAKVGGIYQDEEQGIYVMIQGKGIYHNNPFTSSIKLINDIGHNSGKILSLLKTSDTRFWLGYSNGLYHGVLKNQGLIYRQQLKHDDAPFTNVSAMHKGIEGITWVADKTHITSIDNSGEMHHYELPYNVIASNKKVASLIQDYRGDVWLSIERGGLMRLRIASRQFEHIPALVEQQLHSWLYIWLKVSADRESFAFVKTSNGYGNYDIVNEKLTRVYKTTELKFPYEKQYPIAQSRVSQVDVGQTGNNLFVSFDSSFFAQLDVSGKYFEKRLVSGVDGIVGVVRDVQDRNVYWLASTFGQLYRWHGQNDSLESFSKFDGLPATGIANFPAIMMADGLLLWGSAQGLVYFQTRQKFKNNYRPLTILNRFVLNDVDQTTRRSAFFDGPVEKIGQLNLGFRQNFVEFGFSNTSFAAPLANRYQYRLIGLHDDWAETPAEHRMARYNNLDHGKYVFEVKSSNGQGLWSEPRRVDIYIAPPFWQSYWAYFIYLGCILSYFYIWQRKREKQTELLEQKVSDRTQELVKSKELVEQLMREREHLVENIYHQTRTPLQIMLGNISSLESSNMPLAQFTERQRNEIFKLTHLTDQVLDVSRVTESPKTVIDIASMLNQLAVSYRDIAKNEHLSFGYLIDEKLFIHCSPMSIEKAIDNILGNAIKYTSEGGVCFTAKRTDEHVIIECVDTGIGIPEQDLKVITKRYTRGSNATELPGSGIGLSMIEDVISAHEGQFDIQSTDGEGTKVTITLKAELAIEDVDEAHKSKAQQIIENLNQQPLEKDLDNNEKPSVLVAEDNLELANYLAELLTGDYQVINALSGEEALVKAREVVPDLILSDVMMGSLDGFKLVESIRSCDICCHIPVVLLTAKNDDFSREYGYQVGANDFINKPFKESDLKNRINNQLRLVNASVSRSMLAPSEQQDNAADLKSDDRLIMRFLSFVTDNYTQCDLQIKDVCGELHISNRQLERKVKHFLNMTPNQFLNDFRLSRAKELIDSKETIKDIYFKCGFSSHAYFSKKFKDKYAKTPSEYKKTTS